MGGNLFWGNHLRCLWIKLRSIDAQVLFRLFHPQTTQSTTAITSIVLAKATNLKKLVIARFGNAESKQSKQIKSVRSANHCKSFCHFLLLQKVESLFFLVIARRIIDSRKAIQKNKCASAPRISPDSWCKKSESKGAVVPPADFLLESELRGSPPKSEKWQLLARRGSGAGGAALLQKENCDKELADSKANLSAELRCKIVSKINFSKVTIQ